MILNSKMVGSFVVISIFGGILASNSLGWWTTESTKQAAKYTEGEFAGIANPADIRGSYTLSDIENNFGVPVEVVASAFNITATPLESFQIKNLESMYADSPVEIGTESVRLFVAFYLNLPYDLSSDSYLPKNAVNLLMEGQLSEEQQAYLSTHSIDTEQELTVSPAATDEPTVLIATPTDHINESSEKKIRGTTTFNDLVSWGLSKEAIEEILGEAMPADLSLTVKDFANANNLAFETIKTDLQEVVDGLE
jgi:hypothetical protein